MKILLREENQNIIKTQREPNNSIYNLMLTLILAFAIVWVIYICVGYSNYNVYLTK